MRCSRCGAPLSADAQVCTTCGSPQTPVARGSPAPPGPKAVLTIEGPAGRTTHTLSPGTVTLGRNPENAVVLSNEQISRRHVAITLDANGCTVTDLGSTNGSYLDGTRLGLQAPEPFRDGNTLQVGPFTIHVQVTGLAAPARAPAGPSMPTMPGAAPAGPSMPTMPGAAQAGPAMPHMPGPAQAGPSMPTMPGAAGGGPVSPPRYAQPGPTYQPAPAPAPAAAPAAAASPPATNLDFHGRPVLRIGRATDNDIVVNHPQASRYHAILEQVNQVVSITDLGSTNGTFVNGQRIATPRVPLKDGDWVQVASYRFVLQPGRLQQFDDQGNIVVNALHLTKIVGKGIKILNDVSLAVQPRDFVAIVGGSGAGKSTLLDALNGFRPATEGAVLFNETQLYQNYDVYRNVIGYVPQDDIIHRELTIFGALDYAAQLRLPKDTTTAERHQRIEEVLKDLGLEQRRDTPIGRLSGGQRKRVSIGVELLTKPSLFFLDEPTSGLDPSTETKMMRLMRDLADQGRTVLLVTHVTGNVRLCDKVIIMARGGRLAYYGPPAEALTYFGVREFVDIYDRLETGKPEDLQTKFEQSAQYQQYVAQPLTQQMQAAAAGQRATRAKPGAKRISALAQFIILSKRNLEILVRDKASLGLMLALAPLIGMMDFLTWKQTVFEAKEGNAAQVITMMFMAGLICILVGGIASMREIVKELEVYRRERMVGLGIMPYILSKVWLGALLALYQALVFVIMKAIAVPSMPHDIGTLGAIYLTLTLATMGGMMMGLFVSAISPNQNVAPLLIVLLLVPQFLFSGGMLPIKLLPGGEIISATTNTRWAFNALVTISKMGQGVADDPCWQVDTPKDAKFTQNKNEENSDYLQRWQDTLSESYKRANCDCLGPNIFSRCDFPGVTKKLTPEIQAAVNAPEPAQPTKPGDPPAQPANPPNAPDKPPAAPDASPARPDCNQQDPACQKRLQDWNTGMDNWKKKMDAWTAQMDTWKKQMDNWTDRMDTWKNQMDNWKNQMETYKKKSTDYQDGMSAWQTKYTDWKEVRDKAIGNAEGLVRKLFEDYGDTFNVDLPTYWGVLGGIMAVFFGLTFVAQKRKDSAGR